MAKFFGAVGFAHSVETTPGVWVEEITEVLYYGDVIQNSRRLQDSEYLHDSISLGNSISIVADAYANEHFFAIRYVDWSGALWSVQNVDVKSPRLILRLGGVYNGPKPASRDSGNDSWL